MSNPPKLEWPQGQPLFEVQWRAVASGLAGDGVTSDTDLEVTATANPLELNVAAGEIFFNDTLYSIGSATTLTLSGGDGTYDRWDTVFFDVATSSALVREGTPAASPVPPDLSDADEFLLAIVYVPQNATDVPSEDVLNWRATFSNDADETFYGDTTGVYGVNTVEAALDELQEAAQATAYPFASTDLASPAGDIGQYPLLIGTDVAAHLGASDLLDSSGGSLVYDTSAGHVPRPAVDDQREQTSITSSTYTTTDEEMVLVDTVAIGAASTITLATADADPGNVMRIVDATGAADTNPITIDTEGTETIDGETTATVNQPFSSVILVSDGTDWTTLSTAFDGVNVEDSTVSVIPAATGMNFGSALDVTDDGDETVTVDANVSGKTNLATGTFTHTGGSTLTTNTVANVTTDETTNLYVEVGVDADPGFNAAYAFDYTWDYSWDDTNQEMDVVIEAEWTTDPGSGNDVVLDFEIYTIEDSITQGVSTEDSGTSVVSPARSINFANNLNVTDDGDETVSVSSPSAATPIAKLTTTDSSTNVNQTVLFPWTASPITDPAFGYDGPNTPTRLDITEDGTYEVHLTIGIETGGQNRDAPEAYLYKNRSSAGSGGSQLKAAGKSGYIRENDGHDESSLHLSWVGTLQSGDYLVIQMRQGASGGGRSAAPAETNMFAKKINRP